VIATVALLSMIWGTTWAAIRIGLRGVPPFTGVAIRFAVASVVLLLGAKLLGGRFEGSRREKWLWVANALLSFCASYGILYWSEQWVPSGLASVLFATFPFFVALLAHFALPDEPLSVRTLAGTTVGFLGVAAIFSEDLTRLGGPGVALGAGVLLLAPIASALSNVAIKKWGKGLHPISLTAVPMGIAGGVMAAVALLTERGRSFEWNASSLGAIAYLAIPGSAVTFMLYYWLLEHLPATKVALIAYLSPVVAVTVGALFLDEPYTSRMLLGSALVIAGVALATRPRLRRGATTAALAGLAAWLTCASGWSVPALAAEPEVTAVIDDGPVILPAGDIPESLRSLGPPESFVRFALTNDRSGAAAAGPLGAERKERSTLVVATGGEPKLTAQVEGEVRALRFGPDGALYVLLGRVRGKSDPGEAFVRRVDVASAEKPLEIRVPATAADMDLSPEGNALLVACRNEIRVVTIPDMRSPRLFRVEGDNRSIAAVSGTSQVVLGRTDGLVLVDLGDPQPREGLPVRERVPFEAAVTSLAAAPDRPALLARIADGRTLDVLLDPLRTEPRGTSSAILWPGAKVRAVATRAPQPAAAAAAAAAAAEEPPLPWEIRAPAQAPPPAPVESVPAAQPSAAAANPEPEAAPPQPAPEPDRAPPEEPSPQAVAPPQAEPEMAPAHEPVEEPVSAQTPAESQAPPPAAPPEAVAAQGGGALVRGRIGGAAAAQVTNVVLFGPDNLLREALRVAPAADGSWTAGPLPAGSYRIVLDAGGRSAVVSDPPYARVTVPASGEVAAPALAVTKVLGP